MNTTLLCQRPAACSQQTHARLVQLAQRSQENGEGVSSGRCEVNYCSICQFVQECVCVCIYRVSVDVVVCEEYLFSVCKCAHSRIYAHVAALSPVHNAVSVEGHKVDLTAATRTH